MTICVGIQVNECLVFAADSASTLHYGNDEQGREIINVLPHGHKVFNLHRKLPICAMTCGLGNIGPASISTLAKDLRIAFTEEGPYHLNPTSYTIKEVATKARQFLFEERYLALAEKPQSDMSFYVGGFSAGSPAPERWVVKIIGATQSSPEPICEGSSDSPGVSWGGQPEAIYRMLMGIGSAHKVALKSAGLSDEQVEAASKALLSSMQAPMLHPAMAVQDAINLADFLVETTKRYVRFHPGADTVGGDTDIAVVTKHEGFKWVRRKHYFSRELNPKLAEVDYAV